MNAITIGPEGQPEKIINVNAIDFVAIVGNDVQIYLRGGINVLVSADSGEMAKVNMRQLCEAMKGAE